MTSLGTLIGWFFYGFVRYIIFWIPLLTPPSVDRSPPWQWFRYSDWGDWFHRDDNRGGPDEFWLQTWFRMIFGEALLLAVDEAKPYVRRVRDALRGLIGNIRSQFGSVSGWLSWLEQLFGYPLPWWASTVNRGLSWLRGKLPASIREGWRSWDQLFDAVAEGVRNWVRGVYDHFRNLAQDAWSWAFNHGEMLLRWYWRVEAWVQNFRADPYGVIVGYLGWYWDWLRDFVHNARARVLGYLGPDVHKLLLFGQNAAIFYYNLWSRGWRVLSEFVDDPLGFLYERAERMLIDRW